MKVGDEVAQKRCSMSKYRRDRVSETIKVSISEILGSIKDPRLGFVTVTDVELSHDMSHVKVYVSTLGTDEEKNLTMEALQSARGFIRTSLGQKVRLRLTPEVHFEYDESIERGTHILDLLNKMKSDGDVQ